MILECSSLFYHYLSCGLTIALPVIGVSIGQGLTSKASLEALNLQPSTKNEINRTLIIGLALTETAAILCFIAAMKLLFGGPFLELPHASFIHYSELGIFLALGINGFVAGLASSYPAKHACLAVAQQPFFTNKIQLLMVITQSLMQTPVIFGFIIALLIQGQLLYITTNADSLRLIASGLAIGLGSIGPTLGLAFLAQQSCQSIGQHRTAYAKILYFTIGSAALIESAIIFCFIIAFMLLNRTIPLNSSLDHGLIYIFAAIAMALGNLGVGISSGTLSAKSCKIFAQKPELYGLIAKTSYFSQVFIETCSIYTFIISLGLIFL